VTARSGNFREADSEAYAAGSFMGLVDRGLNRGIVQICWVRRFMELMDGYPHVYADISNSKLVFKAG
jgi:hypothetical protein